MAHNLYRNEQGEYAYIGRRPAWHELGIVTGFYLTWEQIAEKGQLDFQVEKHQLINPFTQVPEAWGIFRMDTKACIGTVGRSYQPIQHCRGFELLDHIIGQQNGAHYESAGGLGGGEKVWGLADINVPLRIEGTDDVSKNFLLFTTSHDGSHSFQVRMTSTRVVCQNTLNQALNRETANKLIVRHSKNALARVEDAVEALAGVIQDVRELEERLNFLASRKVSKATFVGLVDRLFPREENGPRSTKGQNQALELARLFECNDNNQFPEIRGSAYNLLNAATEYADHFRSTKARNETRSHARARSAMFGSGDRFKVEAYSYLLGEGRHLPQMPSQKKLSLSMSGGMFAQSA